MVKNGILCLFFTKNVLPLSSLKAMPFQPVPWMSGLVSGLQNRVRRFESARYLKGVPNGTPFFYEEQGYKKIGNQCNSVAYFFILVWI